MNIEYKEVKMSRKNHRNGGKAGRNGHTTIIDAVAPVVKFLEKSPLVSKFNLGIILQTRSKNERIKLVDINDGVIELTVFGNITSQKVRVITQTSITKFKKALKGALERKFMIN